MLVSIDRKCVTRTSALVLVAISLSLGVAAQTAAQTLQFTTEADTVTGTVTKTIAGELPQSTTIAPIDPSTTQGSGSNSQTAPNASVTIYGVEVYNFTTISNSTDAANSSGSDDGDADAQTGATSLLGGLITWYSNDDPFACVADPNISNFVDCQSTEVTHALTINGVGLALGTYPGGAEFPVAGTINDSQCLLGTETFSGSLIAQESSYSNDTEPSYINLTGMHLVGDATCKTLDAVTLFVTHYDLSIAGPIMYWTDQGGHKIGLGLELEASLYSPNRHIDFN